MLCFRTRTRTGLDSFQIEAVMAIGWTEGKLLSILRIPVDRHGLFGCLLVFRGLNVR